MTKEQRRWADDARARLLKEAPDCAGMVLAIDRERRTLTGHVWGCAFQGIPNISPAGVLIKGKPLPKKLDLDEVCASLAREVWDASGRVLVSSWARGDRSEREFSPPEKPEHTLASWFIDVFVMAGVLTEVPQPEAIGGGPAP